MIISYSEMSLLHLSILNSFSMFSVWLSISAMVASMYFPTSSILSDSPDIPFTITIGNVRFLDVFCIFQYQKNKQFFRFLGIDSMALLFRDGVVRPLCKDSIPFFAILWKPCGSGINIVLVKSDHLEIIIPAGARITKDKLDGFLDYLEGNVSNIQCSSNTE